MEVDILRVQREVAGAETRMHVARAKQQRPVAAHRSAPAQHREIGMRLDAGEVAVHADRSGQRAAQRERGDPAGQAVERQRIDADIGEYAQDIRASVEADDAADGACRALAIVMAQGTAEHRLLQRAGERTGGVELSLEVEPRHEPPDRADVDAARVHGEWLKREILAADIDLALPADLRLRPAGHERVAERPVGLDLQRAHRPVDDRPAIQASVERERVDVHAREIERQITRDEIALPQRHEARVGGAERRDAPREPTLPECQIQGAQLNLEHPAPMRRERHAAVQHGVRGEARIEEVDVGERRGVGAHREVPEQRVTGPLHRAARAELGAGEPHAREIHAQRAAVDRNASDDVGDRQLRIAALGRKPEHVDADALFARRLDAEGGEPRVEVLEAPDTVASIFTGELDLLVGARDLAVLLQPQRQRTVHDLHVPQ